MDVFYARKTDDGKLQTLTAHLNGVGEIAAEFCKTASISRLSGLIHDLGKFSGGFQEYLLSGGKKVVHSQQSAHLLRELLGGENLQLGHLGELLTLCCAAHHNALPDALTVDGQDLFIQRLLVKGAELGYPQVAENLNRAAPELKRLIEEVLPRANAEFDAVVRQILQGYSSRESAHFALGLFIKYIYSCLVDADRLDARQFELAQLTHTAPPDWQRLSANLERHLAGFTGGGVIAETRRLISQQCMCAADKPTGIYRLSVPTGGGKTLSSLRFAVNHLIKHKKTRIIYIIPYLSIIEQTAQTLKTALELDKFDKKILLEHHSNVAQTEPNEDKDCQILAAARWDSPIIVTTINRFLDMVMSAKASNLRRFHNMQDAVIIFDEIQSLPVRSINLFNEAASFLTKFLNTTVLLCTATQPLLDRTGKNNLTFSKDADLIDGAPQLQNSLKRTNIVIEKPMTNAEFADFVCAKSIQNSSCLVIVNTKSCAADIYARVKSAAAGFKVFHLSTGMCMAHRIEVFGEVKKHLAAKDKLIVISTQLIEAGVDISFSCVIRALAGLDSVLQAAGRCNRNGESKSPKNVYAVPLREENLSKLPDIKIGKDIMIRLADEHSGGDFLSEALLTQYYDYYFFKRRDAMDFRVDEGVSVYEMLSLNRAGTGNYKNINGAAFPYCFSYAFKRASDEYYTIADNTVAVVVQYKESKRLIEEFLSADKLHKKIDIIKQLEKFSISLYIDTQLRQLERNRAIRMIDSDNFGVLILDKDCYSDEIGLTDACCGKNLIV